MLGRAAGCEPSPDKTMTTGVTATQRLTSSQHHNRYEVAHREPLEAITLALYMAKVVTGEDWKRGRIRRSGDLSFAEMSGLIGEGCWTTKCAHKSFGKLSLDLKLHVAPNSHSEVVPAKMTIQLHFSTNRGFWLSLWLYFCFLSFGLPLCVDPA